MVAYILMIWVVIFYAGNILVGKAVNEVPPLTMSFFRLVIAFVLLLPIGVRSTWEHRNVFLKHKKPLMVMTLTGVCFFNVFLYAALNYTTATKVSVLEASIPAATVFLSAFLLKERLHKIQWAGVFLSLIGAVCVVTDGKWIMLFNGGWNVGDTLMIGAIVMWAVYSISVKKYMHLFPQYGAVMLMSGISVVVLFPAAALEWYFVSMPAWNGQLITGLLYLGIFPSVVALIFYNRGVELLGPSKASVFLNFLPVATMIGAYLWLGEPITFMQLFGVGVVICGVMMTARSFGSSVSEKSKESLG
ncbi:DMT family transporter [Siminovitchia sediminis]|uniref:DMT family transporter n=1 Tax=Siminovitchia sediminis TaxID=1274353 RepID=A0ABW4KKN1_9BACI